MPFRSESVDAFLESTFSAISNLSDAHIPEGKVVVIN